VIATSARPPAGYVVVPGTLPDHHTMADRLADYVLPKVPVTALAACGGRAVVMGSADLGALVDPLKLGRKRFNRLRPQWRREHGVLVCETLPGVDYTWHYARLLASAAAMLGLPHDVGLRPVQPSAAAEFMAATLPASLRVPEIVVVGYVEHLFTGRGTWRMDSGFGWRYGHIAGEPAALVGCEFSFWGDLAGGLVTVLADRGARWIIYVGKLGTLVAEREPNQWLATGHHSLVRGVDIRWPGHLAGVAQVAGGRLLADQRHVTVPSIVDETTSWFASAAEHYDLVDPEIGHMAAAANAAGVAYDYLHIVSDNLTGRYAAGLYHERSPAIRADRLRCLNLIESTLTRSLR
jgi:hypothetical protein